MHNRSPEIHPKDSFNRTKTQSTRHHTHQYGSSKLTDSRLVALPSESLTHITSYLDPLSLIALGGTNKRLYAHVKDDNTWHRAFVCQFLGIGPEHDLQDVKRLTLRKTEGTWKREFVLRYNLRNRWQRSRNTTLTHIPHHATVSDIYLLSEDALLSSSVQYGIVARSFPSTGKIIKGFLNASGIHHGIGIGNPNAEFTPNVTACALSSEGTSAKIIWGFRDGSVSVMYYPRTMSGGRSAAKVYHSRVDEEHQGAVEDVKWSADGNLCISVAADGRAKIWGLNRFRCVWTSERKTGVVDPCVKFAEALSHGVLAVANRSGEVVIHSEFNAVLLQALDAAQPAIAETRISPPLIPSSNPLQPSETEKPEVSTLFIDSNRVGATSILVTYLNNPWFYRYSIRPGATAIHTTVFGDAACGPIRCILPSFSTGPGESSFVVAGDSSGGISFYDWNATATSDAPISPVRRVEVFPDAFPTCLAMNTIILAAGSSRGTIRVLDAVNFEPLRSIAAYTHDEVRKILLERQTLVASFGNRILSWKAALPDPAGAWKKGKGKRESNAKWQHQIELRRNIAESRDELANEAEYTRRTFGREREQLSELESLGLSEREAVEYVLMLSREEAETRRRDGLEQTEPAQQEEEGIFDVDLDDGPSYAPRYAQPPMSRPSRTPSSTASLSPPLNPAASSPAASSLSRSYPRVLASPSSSTNKVQVSPRFYPEPMEAGGLDASPLNLSPSPVPQPRLSPEDFPAVPRSGNATPTWRSSASVGSTGSGSGSAWNTPLRTTPSSSPPVSRSLSALTASLQLSSIPPAPAAESEPTSGGRDWDAEVAALGKVEDEELRFALELSLAEARSREGD